MTEPAQPAKDASADEIEADIAATRERLAASVDALADKVNVKARAQEKIDDTKQRAQDLLGRATDQARRAPRPVQLAVLGVPVALLLALIIAQIRRRRS